MAQKRIDALALIVDHRGDGSCASGRWTYRAGGQRLNGGHVEQLKRNGMIDVMYFSGGRAGINATDAGIRLVTEMRAHGALVEA